MIITRTPFRISFFGGGTDLPAWYKENGGAVLSTSIDKYCHVSVRFLPPFFEYATRVAYSRVELVKTRDEIEHPVVREVLKMEGIDGVEIHNFNDIPDRAGLGSSSSFTVGLLHAIRAFQKKQVDKHGLALSAIHVEQNLLKENVGSQDQVAAAYGGLNKIVFGRDDEIRVEPLGIDPGRVRGLNDRLMLFFTGFSRKSSDVMAEQIKNISQKQIELAKMKVLVDDAVAILKSGDIDDFGKLLHETWILKKGLSSQVSNSHIDEVYEAGRSAGATGGKILGAGGGGFILFFVPPEKQNAVKEKLANLVHVPFEFETRGSQIIHRTSENTNVV